MDKTVLSPMYLLHNREAAPMKSLSSGYGMPV